MGHELRSLFQVETKRLIWIIGITFIVIVTFQYLELPYGNVISSLFSANKVPVPSNSSFSTDGQLSNSKVIDDVLHENGLNSTAVYPLHETVDVTGISEGKNTDLDNDPARTGNNDSNSLSGLHDAINPVKESSTEELGDLNRISQVDDVKHSDNASSISAPGEARESEQSFSRKKDSMDINHLEGNIRKENITLMSENAGSSKGGFASPSPALPQKDLSANMSLPINVERNASASVRSVQLNTPLGEKQEAHTFAKNETLVDNSSATVVPKVKKSPESPNPAVTTIAEMNNLLYQSRALHHSMTPRWSSTVDQELLYARSQIENAPILKNDQVLYAPIYRNFSMFKRSYELMEDMLKVYVYREGQKPIMHVPVLKGIYASEGWFMKLLEANKKFVVKNPRKAHLFYLPFSSRMLEETLYVHDSHSHKNLIQYLENYLNLISAKYPFWNRTEGADHFLVACHDWAPAETREGMANCIRALCNSDVKEGFVFGKDVSLPETNVRLPQKPLKDLGGNPSSKRPILAFFAGKLHGYLRPILLQHWGGNKDPDMKIFGPMPKVKDQRNYIQHMKSSKYCICAKGYEVNSPRVAEAIFYECVPVIISDNFVPPFFDVLNWESFSVFVLEKDIPNLKKILLSIPKKRYREMQMRVKKVQQHFLWHAKPVKYDIFHMILHSVWYNRVFQI